jgi:hypothetical protein
MPSAMRAGLVRPLYCARMSLFGDKKDGQEKGIDVQAEVERLNSLAVPRLAAEVMVRGFGPDCPAADGRPSVRKIVDSMVPEAARMEQDAYLGLNDLIGEGIQALEHAGLVQPTVWGGTGGLYFVATRRGKAALEQDAVDEAVGAVAS